MLALILAQCTCVSGCEPACLVARDATPNRLRAHLPGKLMHAGNTRKKARSAWPPFCCSADHSLCLAVPCLAAEGCKEALLHTPIHSACDLGPLGSTPAEVLGSWSCPPVSAPGPGTHSHVLTHGKSEALRAQRSQEGGHGSSAPPVLTACGLRHSSRLLT
jgi:hypothetical protein